MTNPRLLHVNQKGVTLIELLVVIALVGLIAAIGYPVFSSFSGSYTFSAAAREVLTTAMQARSNSVRDNASWTVNFNPSGNTYTLADPDGTVVSTYDLTQDYGNGIRLIGSAATTCGNASQTWNGSAIAQAASIAFAGQGFGSNSSVFLVSSANNICLAVNTTITGIIRIHRYDGTLPYADSHWN